MNRFICFSIIWGLYAAISLTAQTIIQTSAQVDSLRHVIATAKHDTTRINAMNEFSFYLIWQRRSDSALTFAREAKQLAERISYPFGKARALSNIGMVYSARQEYIRSLEYHLEALRIFEALGTTHIIYIANSLTSIGRALNIQGKHTEGLGYYFKALRQYELIGDHRAIPTAINNIGASYAFQKKYTEALTYFLKSLDMQEALGDKKRRDVFAASHSNVGESFYYLGKYDKALLYYNKSLQMFGALGYRSGVAGVLNHCANVYLAQGNYDSALAYSHYSLALYDSLKRKATEPLLTLSEIYDSLRQHKQSLIYYKRYTVLKDSLVNIESMNKASALKELYEAEKREQQIALLNKEKALQESELIRQKTDFARLALEQKAQEQSILLLNNEKQMRNLTVRQQEAALTEAYLREERNREALKVSATQSELQKIELDRRNAIQWSLAGILVAVVFGAVWLGALYRQKNVANKEILQQQALLGDQAQEIQQANMELHQQNEDLHALNIEKNELMGIVSHDLKNPIGAVRSYAELIENQTFTGDEVLFASGQIVQVSDRMLELVKNLLDLNQMESGGLQLSMVSFDISPVVEAVVDQYRAPAEAKHITLHFSQEAPENIVSADEQALMQVLDNLVSNAVKYSPHGKHVFVRILRNGEAVRIEIQDEGEGISKEDMKKLFGKFARLSARPTGGEHSTGLGLSIVKRMVEAMNGSVWCESELGKGATFIVELPSAPPQLS